MHCDDYGLFGLLFSAILVVVYFVATAWTFLVLDQFHLALLIQLTCSYIPVRIIIRVAFSWSIAGVVVARTETGFLFLSSVLESVAIRVVWLG